MVCVRVSKHNSSMVCVRVSKHNSSLWFGLVNTTPLWFVLGLVSKHNSSLWFVLGLVNTTSLYGLC